jgi:hypothetical protein
MMKFTSFEEHPFVLVQQQEKMTQGPCKKISTKHQTRIRRVVGN